MSKNLAALSLCCLVLGCSNKAHPPGGEGDEEFDPGVEDEAEDGEVDPGVDTGEPDDELEDVPMSGAEVCYPGVNADYSACFPLVDRVEEMGDAYEYPEPYEGSEQYLAPTRFVDLNPTDHTVPLSGNFALGEFMHKNKGQFGLYQVHAVENLQAIREASGGPLYAHSGYRNVTYNEGVGGAEWSRHIYGDAMDMHSDTVSLSELAELCEDFGAGFTKLYDSHVHCDWRDDPLDSAFFE